MNRRSAARSLVLREARSLRLCLHWTYLTPNSGEAQPAGLGNPGKRTTFCGRPRLVPGLGLHGFNIQLPARVPAGGSCGERAHAAPRRAARATVGRALRSRNKTATRELLPVTRPRKSLTRTRSRQESQGPWPHFRVQVGAVTRRPQSMAARHRKPVGVAAGEWWTTEPSSHRDEGLGTRRARRPRRTTMSLPMLVCAVDSDSHRSPGPRPCTGRPSDSETSREKE